MPKSQNLSINQKENKEQKKEINTRNILLIGKTGSGKSTLANVLLNKNGNFEEVFKESADGVSETKEVKKEQFDFENISYCIIDTIGIGDTKLSKEEVLIKLQDISDRTNDFGLNQILFVTNGRINKEEIENYNLLRKVIFDEEVVNYTTIMRVNFPEFENESACIKDKNRIVSES
jgi:predicted GTPase